VPKICVHSFVSTKDFLISTKNIEEKDKEEQANVKNMKRRN